MSKPEGMCQVPRCRQPMYLIYLDYEICDNHWCSLTRAELRERLGVDDE